jgi:hypothetical protein
LKNPGDRQFRADKMKRFSFSLEKALRYRESQLRTEEGRYAMLRAAETQLRERSQELRSSIARQRLEVTQGSVIDGNLLQQLHRFSLFVTSEVLRLDRECEALKQEMVAQVERINLCRRKIELLGKLQDKERERWTKESARELQMAAEEAFNAKWLREQRE